MPELGAGGRFKYGADHGTYQFRPLLAPIAWQPPGKEALPLLVTHIMDTLQKNKKGQGFVPGPVETRRLPLEELRNVALPPLPKLKRNIAASHQAFCFECIPLQV